MVKGTRCRRVKPKIVSCNHCHWSCLSIAETKLSQSFQEMGLTKKLTYIEDKNKLLEQKNKWTKVSMLVSQFQYVWNYFLVSGHDQVQKDYQKHEEICSIS